MRQLNLAIIFALCLAVAIFGLENTDPVTITFLPGREVVASLALALLAAVGVGMLLAWLLVIWNPLGHRADGSRDRDERIAALSRGLEAVKAELERYRRQPQPISSDEGKGDAASLSEAMGTEDGKS